LPWAYSVTQWTPQSDRLPSSSTPLSLELRIRLRLSGGFRCLFLCFFPVVESFVVRRKSGLRFTTATLFLGCPFGNFNPLATSALFRFGRRILSLVPFLSRVKNVSVFPKQNSPVIFGVRCFRLPSPFFAKGHASLKAGAPPFSLLVLLARLQCTPFSPLSYPPFRFFKHPNIFIIISVFSTYWISFCFPCFPLLLLLGPF